jgi:hypothetical protein
MWLLKHCSSRGNGLIREPSLGHGPQQQQKNCWKQCFLCSPCWGYTVGAIKASQSVAAMRSCETVASWSGHKYGRWGIYIVGSHYRATTSEGMEDFVYCSTVICRVCRSVKLLHLPVATSYKFSINPINNPNPMSSH